MPAMQNSKTPKVLGAILGLAVVGGLVAWALGYGKTPDSAPETTTSTPDGASSTAPAAVPTAPSTSTPQGGTQTGTGTPSASGYRDGTYAADGTYRSPAGSEKVTVGLTIRDGVVTDATFKGEATNPASKNLQAAFAAGYKAQVIGKSVDSISLGVVNGASLTPKGFMDALARIKVEAKG